MAHPAPASFLPHAFATALLAAAAHGAFAADLTVAIENIRDDSGQVRVGVFDSAAAFPKHAVEGKSVPASERDSSGIVRIRFAGLPAGTYAVSAIHDRDGNGKLTTNLVGMPTEPYGFSRQGRAMFGPPAFEEAAFSLPAEGAAVSIGTK